MKSNKKAIAGSFSRSAKRYDDAAQVQQMSGSQLIDAACELIDHKQITTLADIGCGTGYLTQALIDTFEIEHYIGVDLAQGMLDVAANNNHDLATNGPYIEWVCSDAEHLSIRDHSVDLLYANFSLQWCRDLPQLMNSFHRTLSANGYCCFTSLGEHTLHELRNAWKAVDQLSHVNTYDGGERWQQAIVQAGFICLKHYQTLHVSYFDSVVDALRSLKDIGANVVVGHHRQGLTGKQRFHRFIQAYEKLRVDKGIPVTYVVDGWIIQKRL